MDTEVVAADKDGYVIALRGGLDYTLKAVDGAQWLQDLWMAARIADQDFQRGWTHDGR